MSDLSIQIFAKQFGEDASPLFKNFSLTLGVGEFTCLIGPSGCGKSTLLNMIAGLDHDFEGASGVGEKSTIGYIFQEPRLMPWLSIYDNIALVCERPNKSEILDLLDEVGLAGAENSYPSQLSGGMQRRVALVRAFVIKPDILLLDEPFVSLDIPTANRLRQSLLTLWQKYQPTILFVTHNPTEAVMMGERLLFLGTQGGGIILDERIDLPRPRSEQDENVMNMIKTLLNQHPQLLSGQL